MNAAATLLAVETERLLTWRGHKFAAWLFTGYREFRLQPDEQDGIVIVRFSPIQSNT